MLSAYVFESLDQVREISAEWLQSYNEERPHDALAGLPPATYRAQLGAYVWNRSTLVKELLPMERIFRAEVRAFILASETILSHVLLVPPMSEEERKIVQYYAPCLTDRCQEPQTFPPDATTNSAVRKTIPKNKNM